MSALNLHLGDNADFNDGEFATATYVGLRVSLPMRMSNRSEKNQLIIQHVCDRDLGRLASSYCVARLFLSRVI